MRKPEGGAQRRDNRRSGAAEPGIEEQHEQEHLRRIGPVHAVADQLEDQNRSGDRAGRRNVLAERAHLAIIGWAAGGSRYAFLMLRRPSEPAKKCDV